MHKYLVSSLSFCGSSQDYKIHIYSIPSFVAASTRIFHLTLFLASVFLGKFRMVIGISSITDVRVIPPWLGRQSLVCVTQESPRGGEVDCWRNKFSLDPPFFILIVRICKPDDGSHEPKHVAHCTPLFFKK